MKMNELTMAEAKARYIKVTRAVRYFAVLFILTAAGILFLPPSVLNVLSSKSRWKNNDNDESSVFTVYGWPAVGIAAVIIAGLLLIILLFFNWWELRKRVRS